MVLADAFGLCVGIAGGAIAGWMPESVLFGEASRFRVRGISSDNFAGSDIQRFCGRISMSYLFLTLHLRLTFKVVVHLSAAILRFASLARISLPLSASRRISRAVAESAFSTTK